MVSSNEDLARKAIEKKLVEYENQSGSKPTGDMIETNIYNVMDEYELNITNFYRIRRYLIEKFVIVHNE